MISLFCESENNATENQIDGVGVHSIDRFDIQVALSSQHTDALFKAIAKILLY